MVHSSRHRHCNAWTSNKCSRICCKLRATVSSRGGAGFRRLLWVKRSQGPECGTVVGVLQMSERLQELERAVTVDPLECSSDGDRREEAGISRRTSSVGLVRKSSLSIRRTISSFKCAASLLTCWPR